MYDSCGDVIWRNGCDECRDGCCGCCELVGELEEDGLRGAGEFAASEGGGIAREIRGEEAEDPDVECVCAQCSARIGGDGTRFAREPAFR